jgi:hypothetical protein
MAGSSLTTVAGGTGLFLFRIPAVAGKFYCLGYLTSLSDISSGKTVSRFGYVVPLVGSAQI